MRSIDGLWVLAAAALISGPVAAFETPLHEGITREAMAGMGFDARTVADIVEADAFNDRDAVLFNLHAAHFDSEAFAAGSTRLRDKLLEAMNALDRCNRAQAIAAIGTSLHAIQDFFAHSNYIELHERDPKAQIDLFHLKDPPRGLPCWSPGYSEGLTSGYWPNDPARMKKIHKCTHDELAKDSPAASTYWYPLARARAVTESANYLHTIESSIRGRFGDKADAVLGYLKSGATDRPPGSYCAPACSPDGTLQRSPGMPGVPTDLIPPLQ